MTHLSCRLKSRLRKGEMACFMQDYLFSYRDKIKAVTAQDVLGAAQRHLHPRKQLVVVAADANANRGQLEKQGRPIVSLTLD